MTDREALRIELILPAAVVDSLASCLAAELSRKNPRSLEDQAVYMTVLEAAEYMGWSKNRIYKLTAAGAIPHMKHGNRILFRRTELDEWLGDHSVRPRTRRL